MKWAGGKRQLLPELSKRVPRRINRYFEPMIGGGAFFFSLSPRNAYIADINSELINTYEVIRDRLPELLRALKKHHHNEEYYYTLRNIDRSGNFKQWGPVKRASRLLYLNRTCFNGLYRVNSRGEFNVPFGRYKNPRIIDEGNLRACSLLLQHVEIQTASFESVLDKARTGDFVYFDPPYVPLNSTSNFTSYIEGGFDENMQRALLGVCMRLDKNGVKFMLSNSSAPLVLELYNNFKIESVEASRTINSKANGRGKVKEVIVTNY
ncbi:MAG: DNA adenine methylase [Bdellovibrionales bacterium]|nr:DNA adenine methylase [Bdellovibrionales bacterium]